MADKETATALKNLGAARADVLTSLRAMEVVSQGEPSTVLRPLPTGLAEATQNILSSLRQTVTTLSLAFKPPLTAAGITRYLDKARDELGRLVSCVVAASAGNVGSVLVEEWRAGVEQVGHEVERLLAVLEDGVRAGAASGEGSTSTSSSTAESPYLAHTGLVWEAIDRIKSRLPFDERAAVAHKWDGQKAMMRDAWDEFKEMLEDAEEDEDDDEDDGFGFDGDGDEEWAELEKAMNASMTAVEKKRAEAAKPLLGLHQILHTSVPRFLPQLALDPEEPYTALVASASGVVAAFDVAVSAMYPKHDVAEINGGMEALNAAGRGLVDAFTARLARSVADKEKKDAAASFAARWTERLDAEAKSWHEKRLGMGELADAL